MISTALIGTIAISGSLASTAASHTSGMRVQSKNLMLVTERDGDCPAVPPHRDNLKSIDTKFLHAGAEDIGFIENIIGDDNNDVDG